MRRTRTHCVAPASYERARSAILQSDTDGVSITLTACWLQPTLTVRGARRDEAGADRLRQAGATRVVSPDAIAGHLMAQAILRPAVPGSTWSTSRRRERRLA